MALDLRTTQEYLNAKAGTVGLTKQQALARLAGVSENSMSHGDAANNYAGTTGRSGQEALNVKVGTTGLTKQEAARRL